MNAVEIEQAVSELAFQPFDAKEFPFAFLSAFGNKETTLRRLRAGNSNASDVPGGVLRRNHIHIAVSAASAVGETLKALRESAATGKAKARFILATDGATLEAEDLANGETLACVYSELAGHFAFFLPLAGISTIKEIKDNPIDVRATGRLNKLYVELLREDPNWAERRHDMNHFMARLIFCFFAEDTDIFNGEGLFTQTIEQMSERDGSNTHEVLSEIFRAMNIRAKNRVAVEPRLSNWTDGFPYVNGGLFSGAIGAPRFMRLARAYLLHAGGLKWREINPDIFGSMIQTVADDEERGAPGMHYTSVPNILKVLNPLYLDDLRAQLEAAGDNERKLLNLRRRLSRIRVFDPACGSGNFLVIAYKQMRSIEAEINRRRGESYLKSEIPVSNFRGIELRDFPAEIARLALIIAEFQCDVLYRGQKDALAEFLPLDARNRIVCGNALRLDWLSVCPPTGTGVKLTADDLFGTPLEQTEIDYRAKNWKSLDYVAGWFMKAADYGRHTRITAAFVSTNSICQGQLVPILWPLVFKSGHEIAFAHTSFKWANLASHNAGVTVVIVGISNYSGKVRRIYSVDCVGEVSIKNADYINAYLVSAVNIIVKKRSHPFGELAKMNLGNKPVDDGNLLLVRDELDALRLPRAQHEKIIRRIYGSEEFIHNKLRYCPWIEDEDLNEALSIAPIRRRIEGVRMTRLASSDKGANRMANRAHQMKEMNIGLNCTIVIPAVSSEEREFLPVGIADNHSVITNRNHGIHDESSWNMAILASRLHWIWVDTVCGKLELRFNYSNTLGWNTFPVPLLTEQNKIDLTRCAENILLAREAHFPATIADLYAPDAMPENLRHAHEMNDETLERIYIGRRFRNDTERPEKLFDLYTKMTVNAAPKARNGEKTP
ncbi:MAG: lactate dehydrogenase [Candidatus Accumulibacter sp.]|jgi:hypothetical protein|nr:lactate dehydrogenase [Accumulibacter sp.]